MYFIFLALWGMDTPPPRGTFYISNLSQFCLIYVPIKKVTTYISTVHVRNMNLNQGNNDRE